ncbi:MAG: leucyl aminopeptidase family protein [Parvularculaceae bacterium]
MTDGAVDECGAPETLVALARANGFSGETGGVFTDGGDALLGAGDGSDPFIAAAAAEKLPEGVYAFARQMTPAAADLAMLGWLMGGYRFDRYKKQKPAVARLVAPENADLAAARRAGDAIELVRDLVNTPAGDMGPEAMEAMAREIAGAHGAALSVTTGDELLVKNLPMIHAVGRAAKAAPRLLDLTWGDASAPKLTLVGKGVTFDSGGLDIKNASGMLLMKKDMGGAAHAFALARMIMSAKLIVRLRVLTPVVENAISGDAFRPGDILKSRSGLTVEIGNTDAEGRLVLADALSLGGEEQPALMISLATLTGAARVALGPEVIPYYCDDDALCAALDGASARAADPVWRMPLWRPYDSMLSSTVADMNNVSSGTFAGSVLAALFLRKFAGGAASWMHFDIYAWRPKAAPGRPLGGEAQAIRALFEVLRGRFPPR